MGFEGGFGGVGIFAIVATLVGLAFWGLVIVALVLGVRWLLRQNRQDRYTPPPAGTAAEDPLEVLRHRYARGEIDEEEYERRRKTLAGN